MARELARDPAADIRAQALEALGEDKDPDEVIVAILTQALRDDNNGVRCAAARALQNWCGKGEDAVQGWRPAGQTGIRRRS